MRRVSYVPLRHHEQGFLTAVFVSAPPMRPGGEGVAFLQLDSPIIFLFYDVENPRDTTMRLVIRLDSYRANL